MMTIKRSLVSRLSLLALVSCCFAVSSFASDTELPKAKQSFRPSRIIPPPPIILNCPPCPTNAPPTNKPWTSHGPVQMLIGDCDLYVCYCTRETSPGNHDFTVTQIQISSCPEDAVATIDDVLDFMRDTNPMGFPCPPCIPPGYENNWREVQGTCWKSITDPDGTRYLQQCDNAGWCMTPYRVCCDENGVRQYIQGATVHFPASCPAGCDIAIPCGQP
jgi:hypothetical protein